MKKALSNPIEIRIIKESNTFNTTVSLLEHLNGVSIFDINFSSETEFLPKKVTLQWKIPAIKVKGVWKPTTDFSKRIMDDWELDHMESRISVDAPVISIFDHNDQNIIAFACSDAINTTELNALYREEDNFIYCHISFFIEKHHAIKHYNAQLRIDQIPQHFSTSLKNIGAWWETFDNLTPTKVPELAKVPVYSTWYQFHQKLDTKELLNECAIAKDIGYDLIILDDGWQTNDENRGYDYTGDWIPERIPKMRDFVDQVHETGMKLALWYSVPFCGKNSKAYQKFKDKFLTEEHRWAPVFDPRYPEVRRYLIGLYCTALENWNLDGFKFDFIDEFKVYPTTVLNKENGRDFASVNLAVNRLMTDIIKSLQKIKPNVVIEFRQKYTGPAMRKYGNMFRAFDCPGDTAMNRVRITDIKIICGDTAVHSDMFTYHPDETVELKALQLINTLFGVPQLSVRLQHRPLANYPLLSSSNETHTIIGLFDNYIVDFEGKTDKIDIINGQLKPNIIIDSNQNHGSYHCIVYSCIGTKILEKKIVISKGISKIEVPTSGMVQLVKQETT